MYSCHDLFTFVVYEQIFYFSGLKKQMHTDKQGEHTNKGAIWGAMLQLVVNETFYLD